MYDIAIIGGGILGATLAYQLSKAIPGVKIVVLEKENDVARHTSRRNTGVLHRPFYLDPEHKAKFARCAQESYGFWKEYVREKNLPWKEIGTLEVALDEASCARLKKYKQWSLQNGMADAEVRLLTAEEARGIEPNVRCLGALLCNTDTAVDFGAFTRALKADAQRHGVEFRVGCEVNKLVEDKDKDEVEIVYQRLITPPTCLRRQAPSYLKRGKIVARYVVNCAGGAALRLAHEMGLARQYADVNFRGEYLVVEGASARLASRNIYSIPRHSEFPFLDPHYIVRHDGQVEIGPTAVPVFSPYAYNGLGNVFRKFCERPILNKLKLFANPEFLGLCREEWRSVLFKKIMVERVRKFLPALQIFDCVKRGIAGVRASLIDRRGRFVPEAVEIQSPRSLHILNYNSPGATGAPAYAAYLVKMIKARGVLNQ